MKKFLQNNLVVLATVGTMLVGGSALAIYSGVAHKAAQQSTQQVKQKKEGTKQMHTSSTTEGQDMKQNTNKKIWYVTYDGEGKITGIYHDSNGLQSYVTVTDEQFKDIEKNGRLCYRVMNGQVVWVGKPQVSDPIIDSKIQTALANNAFNQPYIGFYDPKTGVITRVQKKKGDEKGYIVGIPEMLYKRMQANPNTKFKVTESGTIAEEVPTTKKNWNDWKLVKTIRYPDGKVVHFYE